MRARARARASDARTIWIWANSPLRDFGRSAVSNDDLSVGIAGVIFCTMAVHASSYPCTLKKRVCMRIVSVFSRIQSEPIYISARRLRHHHLVPRCWTLRATQGPRLVRCKFSQVPEVARVVRCTLCRTTNRRPIHLDHLDILVQIQTQILPDTRLAIGLIVLCLCV